jgi:hypothetical protein
VCVIEIRPEQGGADALACASYIAAAIGSWAARQGWAAHVTSGPAARTITVRLPGVPDSVAG